MMNVNPAERKCWLKAEFGQKQECNWEQDSVMLLDILGLMHLQKRQHDRVNTGNKRKKVSEYNVYPYLTNVSETEGGTLLRIANALLHCIQHPTDPVNMQIAYKITISYVNFQNSHIPHQQCDLSFLLSFSLWKFKLHLRRGSHRKWSISSQVVNKM